jgi:NifB/MoaA-like Fe-S oxidoreductase
VGISKYREEGALKKVDKKVALETIKLVEEFNKKAKKQIAMASDEFFLLAGVEIPDKKYYGDFLQIEVGVSAIRLLKDSFNIFGACRNKIIGF